VKVNRHIGVAGLAAGAILALFPSLARAQDQQPRERPGWPCVGRADPVYVSSAEATGGQVFLFDKSEIGESGALMLATLHNEETVYRASGSLTEGVHEFTVPLDSTLESAVISVSLQCLQVAEIRTPAGDELRATDPGVDYHQFEAGRIVSLTHPSPGPWKIVVSGRGMFFLVVQGRTSLSIGSARFVAPGGRPGHEGLFPIQGRIAPGSRRLLEVSLHGAAANVSFQLVSSQGEVLQRLDLRPEEGGADDDRTYLGELTPRAREYRLQVLGTDPAGHPFSRMHAPLFSEAHP
jgi:hypothetical protein